MSIEATDAVVPSLASLEAFCRHYADVRDNLQRVIDAMQADLDEVKRRHLDEVRAALREVNTAEAGLRAEVELAPAIFTKPRTATFHGIRIGFMKGKGGLKIADEARTVERIEKLLPEQAETLLKVTKKPVKDALEQLDAAMLKRLGIHVVDAVDEVYVKAVATDLDKLIKALSGDDGLTEDAP